MTGRRGGPLLLAVDGGTQSTKVQLVDAAGRIQARARSALRPLDRSTDGQAEHPGDDLWDSLAVAVGRLLGEWGGDARRIAGLGLCSIRCCQAVLDADGGLLAPVRSWMDERTWQPWAADELVADSRVATVGAASAYLTQRLTGERADARAAYDSAWLGANEVSAELLPRLVDPGDVLGVLLPSAASALGLPSGLPVVATGNDKAVEALGAGMVAEEDALLLSLGTYAAGMTPVADGSARALAASGGESIWLNESCPPGTMLAETGGVRHGMGTVSWAADLTGRDAGELAERALLVPPGAAGLIAVPDWVAPASEPWRRGALLGLTPAHGAPEIFRAVAEGLVLTLADHVLAAEDDLDHRFATVLLSGGGSRAALLRQIAAAALDRPVVVPEEPDAAGLGAAVCAAVGAGLHAGWQEAVDAMVRRGPAEGVDDALVAAYRDLGPRHWTLRCAIADLLRPV